MKNSPPDPSRRPRVNVSPYQGPPPEQRRYLGTLGLAPSGHTIERKPHPGGWAGVVHSLGKVQQMAQEGMTHPTVRAWAIEKLKAGGNPRDNVGRAKVILESIRKEKIWVPDPVNTEMMQGAHLTLGGVFAGGDCFAQGTLLLTDRHELVPIEQIEVGTRIWGLDRWVHVEAAVAKGTLPIDVVCLNNGSQMRLTADHHVNVLICPKHPHPDPDKTTTKPCACPVHERVAERMRVGDLKPGMVLPTPERLPFGTDESLTPERAYIEGLYIADGWSEESRFSISGKDGHPKEAQKREVQDICARLGLKTSWQSRYIRVNDAAWTERMSLMGGRAPEKHLLSLDLGEAQVVETLRGIMADSGVNACGSRTLTTTSRQLAVQARVLHKMLGLTCGWSYIENHGGLGQHPIWRLTPRKRERDDGRATWLLRVRSIERQVVEVPCYDIQTEDHNVYLPEHDVTVLNCDDLTIATLAAYLAACNTVGAQAAVVGHSYTSDREVTHVLGAVLDGKTWHYVEPSTDKVEFGDAYAPTREVVLWVPGDGTIACDADRCLTGSNTRMPRGASATFVGISGVGVGGGVAGFDGLGAADETALQESGDPSIFAPPSVLNKETSAGVGAWIFGLLEGVVARRDELLRSWQALQEIVDEQSVFSQSEGWTEEDVQRTRKLVVVGDFIVRALNEILEGKRQLFFGKNDNAFAMGHGPDDLEFQIDVAARTVEVKPRSPSVFTNGLGTVVVAAAPVAAPAAAPAAAAAAPVVAAPFAVPVFITVALVGLALIAAVYGWASLTEWQAHRAQEETRRRIAELYEKCLTSPDCTPEQRERIGAAFGKAAQGLQPAGAPPIGGGAAGGGSGYGWSWLGWPLLIGVAALAFTGASREYVRLANRSRRIRRRDQRESSERSRAARTRVVRGEKFVGVDPSTGQPLVTTVDDETESSLLGSFARALLS